MDVMKPLIALLLAFSTFACSQQKSLSSVLEGEDNGDHHYKTCGGQKIENKFIVQWEDGRIETYYSSSYEDFKNNFVEPNLEHIKRVEFDRVVQLNQPYTPPLGGSAESFEWAQDIIEASHAWNQGYYGQNVVVGVIDTWIDYTHPQLKFRFQVNTGEIPNNNIDDDNNGYVDDYYGFNFYSESSAQTPPDHGTHVAGMIVADHATGSVKGIAPGAKIISAPFLNSQGYGSISDAIAAFDYLKMRGVKIINSSWGGLGCSSALRQKMEELVQAGVLLVTAAGNNGQNVERYMEFPSSFNLLSQINVAAGTRLDFLAGWSNYSYQLVHVVAPGEGIYSTVPLANDSRGGKFMSGTSMASPIVAGAAAVVWSVKPHASYQDVKNALLNSVDVGRGFAVSTQGRLNLRKAVDEIKRTVP